MPEPLRLHRPLPRPDAALRLFCFPHAGGGASAYQAWPDLLGAGVDVIAIRLPGRESRFAERRCRTMPEVTADLCPVLRPLLDRPFVFFGHSLGALIAFETARELVRTGAPEPAHLLAAACRAPTRTERSHLHTLPPDTLVERLRKLGGMPPEILSRPDLLSVLLPAIRDDLEVAETYHARDPSPLSCPVTALGGREDRAVSPGDLTQWRSVTSGPFEAVLFPGGHFFVTDPESGLMRWVRDALGGRSSVRAG